MSQKALTAFRRYVAKKRRYDRLGHTDNGHIIDERKLFRNSTYHVGSKTGLNRKQDRGQDVRPHGDHGDHGVETDGRNRNDRNDRNYSCRSLEEDIIATAAKRTAILRWIQRVRELIRTKPITTLGVSHYDSTGYYLQVSKVFTRIQNLQKRYGMYHPVSVIFSWIVIALHGLLWREFFSNN